MKYLTHDRFESANPDSDIEPVIAHAEDLCSYLIRSFRDPTRRDILDVVGGATGASIKTFLSERDLRLLVFAAQVGIGFLKDPEQSL